MMATVFNLFRLRLAAVTGVSAVAGYLLFPAPVAAPLLAAWMGVTLLCAGSSAWNQVQERELDLRMARTRLRPLPAGLISPAGAVLLGTAAILAGTVVLCLAGGLLPALLGLAAVAFYLCIYTPLKRHTHLALPFGAICGAVPPVIGWCVAGGDAADYRAMLLALLLYLWQVPHFWLLQKRHADDYRLAGFPLFHGSGSVNGYFNVWLAALCSAAVLFPLYGLVGRHPLLWCTTMMTSLVGISVFRSRPLFLPFFNSFPVLVTLLLFACVG